MYSAFLTGLFLDLGKHVGLLGVKEGVYWGKGIEIRLTIHSAGYVGLVLV